ncbi:TPA: hypothetical protein N0F65_007410 [Lagenidium giganteum]|uniref:GIY-YIG domain-containing protein n=1 Tax=Lagenidium giganteum TaxID=4803 RepID=A0AAV2ZCR1_9STRA|nr:TPA: hypothetical protein N0F65_007410 [Lagenidium giganteum]
MSDIKIGRVYKIICTQSDHVYVGSTFNTVRDRFHAHKGDYKSWLKGKHSEIAIYPFFKQEYEVVDRTHLEAYEQLWISKLTCVNKTNPIRIAKLSQKSYYEENEETIKEKGKTYREKNKDTISARDRQYYANNKEKFMKYNLDNKDCPCGGKYTNGSKAKHNKTKKHIKWQSSQ